VRPHDRASITRMLGFSLTVLNRRRWEPGRVAVPACCHVHGVQDGSPFRAMSMAARCPARGCSRCRRPDRSDPAAAESVARVAITADSRSPLRIRARIADRRWRPPLVAYLPAKDASFHQVVALREHW
jgi:hypothetical protein